MYIDFIFFKKQFETKDNLERDVKKFLENNLHYKLGYIHYNENNIKCSIGNSNIKKAIPVRIEIDDETESNIEIFSICKEIIKDHSKKDFYLNISYDGLSRYFSYNLYPNLAEFERKLRSIAYSTLINDLGYDWVSKSFPHNDTTKSKLEEIERKEDKNKEEEYSKLIKNALEEFYLKDLEAYLFTEYQYPNDHMIVEDLLSIAKRNSIDQEEIKDIESKRIPKSLINRYFDNDDLKYIKNNFSFINGARNDVMHNKEISMKKYKKYIKPLKKSLRIVNSLHAEINIGKYKKVEIGEIASAFNNAYRSMVTFNESIEGLRSLINTELSLTSRVSINSIGESIKSQIPKSAIESLVVPMNDHLPNISQSAFGNNSMIYDLGKMQDQLGELAGASKIAGLNKSIFSEEKIGNKMIDAMKSQRIIMDLNLNAGDSLLDYDETDNTDESKD